MEEQFDNYMERCRCCLEENTIDRLEIDSNIEIKFFEMTQLNLVASNFLPSFICYDCYEILTNYSNYRTKFIENQQKFDQVLISDENCTGEMEANVIEYEEYEVAEDEETEIVIEHIKPEVDTEEAESEDEDEDEEEEEEELKLEDIVKPEFLHYCKPPKIEEPVIKRVFQIPKQLEKKRHKIEKILKEQQDVKEKQKVFVPCTLCRKHFPNNDLMIEHVHTYHKKFICEFEECEKIFYSQAQLDKHVMTEHHKKFLHECNFCSKKFALRLHLRNHLYTHTQ